jgi:hypothetical protein
VRQIHQENHFHQVIARAQDIIDATEGRLVAAVR